MSSISSDDGILGEISGTSKNGTSTNNQSKTCHYDNWVRPSSIYDVKNSSNGDPLDDNVQQYNRFARTPETLVETSNTTDAQKSKFEKCNAYVDYDTFWGLSDSNTQKDKSPLSASLSNRKSGRVVEEMAPTSSEIQPLNQNWMPLSPTTIPDTLNANCGGALISNKKEESADAKETKKENEIVLVPALLERYRNIEENKNIFTKFFKNDNIQITKKYNMSNYTHRNAINFAAMCYIWNEKNSEGLPVLPRLSDRHIHLPQSYPSTEEVCAFYKVLKKKEQKYILIACHVNVHGYHRGDLRFLEVNQKTRMKGFEENSIIGHLFIGDIVAVTELVRCNGHSSSVHKIAFSVWKSSPDDPCSWMASRMTLAPRRTALHVTFSMLKNRLAVIKGHNEPMTVITDNWEEMKPDVIINGMAFTPIKLENCYASDFLKEKKHWLILATLKIWRYPNPFGTIYQFEKCGKENVDYEVGQNAFSSNLNLSITRREEIVELCSIMGASAARTILRSRFDDRLFQMEDIKWNGTLVKFFIKNPPKQPTLGLWNASHRILICGQNGSVNGVIETVLEEPGSLRITARLSSDAPKDFDFLKGKYYVSQREVQEQSVLCNGYFSAMNPNCNGRKIIETLYGADSLKRVVVKPSGDEHLELISTQKQFYFPITPRPMALNKFQREYVQMLLDGNPLVICSAPFGCGKSMTIITAAIEIYKRNCDEKNLQNKRQQLLITQSNYGSVNLINIANRICMDTNNNLEEFRFVRYITENNWNELPCNCRTDHDLPYLMNTIFSQWTRGHLVNNKHVQQLNSSHLKAIILHILKNELVHPNEFCEKAAQIYNELHGNRKSSNISKLTEAFFILYQPSLIMTTADSSMILLKIAENVCTVQIDEASQLPEYTLLGLLKTFQEATFGLIGDIHQLPPYCEDSIKGRLKEYGIGNTLKRAISHKLFPVTILKYVYRCHPKITELLSDLFYDWNLISGVTESMRNEFVRNRPDFWNNPNFPLMIVNNTGDSFKSGTSVGNTFEQRIVGKIVKNLLHNAQFPVSPKHIGVISFYNVQVSALSEHLRETGVTVGTVDAFQGSEREIMILCCTNEKISEFMQFSNRLNVAMSRAKQATIIVGNLESLTKANYWKTVVSKVKHYGNIVKAEDLNLGPRNPYRTTVINTNPYNAKL